MPNTTCQRCQTSFAYSKAEVREVPMHHELLCGDSTKPEDVEKLLRGDKPFIMVTDPPYGVDYDPDWRVTSGLQEGGANGEVHNDTRCDWRDAWQLFTGDVAYVWHAGRYASTVQESLESVGLLVRAQIVWAKNQMVISRGAYHWKHEPLWYAVREGCTAKWVGGRDQTSVWEIDKNRSSETGHSTQKPLECMARPIRNHGAAGDIVYDPFVGSGTTILAAENLRRRCLAVEIAPAHCAVVLQRYLDTVGLRPIRFTSERSAPPKPVG